MINNMLRSLAASKPTRNNAICCSKIGSNGLSAKITHGRAAQMTSVNSTSRASKMRVGSERHNSNVSPALAAEFMAERPKKTTRICLNIISPLDPYIGSLLLQAKGYSEKILSLTAMTKGT